MIHGGPLGGDSNRSRKAYVREAQAHNRHNIYKIEKGVPPPDMSFGLEDDKTLLQPHDDALIITAEVERYEVKCIFKDTRAAENVIFESCLKQKSVNKPLKVVTTTLHGFVGEVVILKGSIDLMLTMGEGDIRISKLVTILVIQHFSAYNMILGRLALNTFQVAVSIYYMKKKFPVGTSVGQMLGDQALAHECYMQSMFEKPRRGQPQRLRRPDRKWAPKIKS